MSSIKYHRLNQRGIGSLLFTLIMIVIISLIVLGFAQLARRNQRQTLDSQLSTQAYYAAESGVNAALRIVRGPHTYEPGDKTTCNQLTDRHGAVSKLSPGSETSVKYTCVLVDEGAQDQLVYQNVSTSSAIVVPINPDGSLTQLKFTWDKPSGVPGSVSDCVNDNNLPSASSYACPYAMMRIDIVPLVAGATHTIASLQSGNKTFFVKPTNGGSGSFALSTSDPLQRASCTNGAGCSVAITGMSGSYVLHISTVYRDIPTLSISPNSDVKLAGAQVTVDATGRAEDVLRRIRVRAPIDSRRVSVTGAIISNQSICKRFEIGGSAGYSVSYPAGLNCP